MTTTQNKAIIARLYDAIAARDWAALDDLMTRDVVDHSPLFGEPSIHPDAIRQSTEGMLAGFPDLVSTIENVVAEGDLVAFVEVGRGTHTREFNGLAPTGRTIEGRAAHIVRIADGRIVEHWAVRDLSGLGEFLPSG
jgi:predicted ester cyclase